MTETTPTPDLVALHRATEEASRKKRFAHWPAITDPWDRTSMQDCDLRVTDAMPDFGDGLGDSSHILTPVVVDSLVVSQIINLLDAVAYAGSERAAVLRRRLSHAALGPSFQDIERSLLDAPNDHITAVSRAMLAGDFETAAAIVESKADNVRVLPRRARLHI